MKIYFFAILNLIELVSTQKNLHLEIYKSGNIEDDFIYWYKIPMVISLSNEMEKRTGVDLVCLVDGPWGLKNDIFNLEKETLKYLVSLMNDKDNFCLYTFNYYYEFNKMTSTNKEKLLNNIDKLNLNYSNLDYSNLHNVNLESGLNFFTYNYTSGERVATIVLLSDSIPGQKEIIDFKNYLSATNKKGYSFSIFLLIYGNIYGFSRYDELSSITNFDLYCVNSTSQYKKAINDIYYTLSNVCEVNLQLNLESDYLISNIIPNEFLYGVNLTNHYNKKENETMKNTMTSKIMYLTSGKKYELSILLDIQIDAIKAGNEVLKATIYPFGISATYYWESEINPYGYEVYIKFYCLYSLFNALYFSDDIGLSSYYISTGFKRLEVYYRGNINFLELLNGKSYISNYYKSSYYSSLCWSIIDLKRLEISINSTLNNLTKNPHIIDISKLPTNIVYSKEIINYEVNINYYFFYLKEGIGEINNLLFSEESSIIIIYIEEIIGNINITSLTDFVEYHYFKERKTRIQTITEFYHPIKFIVQKDSPIEFYTKVDGTMDVTFNIQIFKIHMEQIFEEDDDLFEIIAYIINDEELDIFYNNKSYQPDKELYTGSYDKNLKTGEITIKKEDISIYLS